DESCERLLLAGQRTLDQIRRHRCILASGSSGTDTGRRRNWAVPRAPTFSLRRGRLSRDLDRAAKERMPMSREGQSKGRLGWGLGLTSTAYFMVALDALVVITALPRIGEDLHVGLSSLQWTVNSYGIAFAAGIITAAALGDRYGRRLVFNCGLALFTLASAACALAPDGSTLI